MLLPSLYSHIYIYEYQYIYINIYIYIHVHILKRKTNIFIVEERGSGPMAPLRIFMFSQFRFGRHLIRYCEVRIWT